MESTEPDRKVRVSCPDGRCDGTGYVNAGYHRVKRCVCQVRRERAYSYRRLLEASGMEDYQDMTLESFEPHNSRQRQALASMGEHGSFYLFGPWGVGKTHLVAGTALRAMSRATPAAMISVPRLIEELKPRAVNPVDVERAAVDIPYLCLDDIGKQQPTDFTEVVLFRIIDERGKRHRSGRGHTSFSSQWELDKLAERMDGAIVSRIRGMCVELFVDGEDMRRAKK